MFNELKKLEDYTLGELKEHEFMGEFLNEETAEARFYMEDYVIYKSDKGEYYCSRLPFDDREFFYFGDVEPLSKLGNSYPGWDDTIKWLESYQEKLNDQIKAVSLIQKAGEMLVIAYVEELQTFIMGETVTLKLFDDDSINELRDMMTEMEIAQATMAEPVHVYYNNDSKLEIIL